ncbi:hypothetical protein [uncultured Paraglaciecola sp.]|uniref:hypothetical protein n=1 Tax=uncultured Paraglaciecola sp. TaxID=1765024 RepID=UPI0030D82A95|tara:strand:- start:87766 stop:88317 length:552 start_codon:yes stop_codon:yes gene_type:complete
MITRQAFHYLYVNANCLTELALRALPADLDSLLDDLEPIDNAELALELETNLKDLNFDAMEGLDFYDSEVDSTIADPVAPPPKEDLSSNNKIQTSEQEGEFDIETYMTNVYSLEEQLIARIDSAYARIDHDEIKMLLTLLPPELPAIDGKLSGEAMNLWLQQYANDVEAITNLLIAIRQLDFT